MRIFGSPSKLLHDVKTFMSICAMILFAGTAMAQAADPYNPEPEAPYEVYSEPAFTGFGFHVNGGFGGASIDIGNFFDGISADGGEYGVDGQYLFRADDFRFGPVVEYYRSNFATEFGNADALAKDQGYGGGLVIGYVTGHTMISAHALLVREDWSSDFTSADIEADWLKLGGCVDTMLNENVSFGLCGDYLSLRDAEVGGTDVTDFIEDTEQGVVKARLGWQL